MSQCDGNHDSMNTRISSLGERVAALEATIKIASIVIPVLTSALSSLTVFLVTRHP